MITPEQESELLDWIETEYDRRTKLVEQGNLSPRDIVWLNPDYRVQFSEVMAKADDLGIDTSDVAEFRLWLAHRVKL